MKHNKRDNENTTRINWLVKLATIVTIVYVMLILLPGYSYEDIQKQQEKQQNTNSIASLSDESTPNTYIEDNVHINNSAETEQTVPTEQTIPEQTEEVTQPTEELPKYKYCDVPLSHELQDFVYKTAEKYDIPAGLLFAVMDVESDFRIDVISCTNDYGLCQINVINHGWLEEQLGLDNMLDPYQNITACAYIYSDLLKANDGDINLAAMCYNCGSRGAAKLWKQGIYSTDYSRKVISAYNELYSSFDQEGHDM